MKKSIFLFIILTFIISCKNETTHDTTAYHVDVDAKGVYNGIRSYIFTVENRNREIKLDTAMVINEAFSFDGHVQVPSIKYLSVDGVRGRLPIILEPGTISIKLDKDNIENSEITGTKNNEDYQNYLESYKQFRIDISKIRGELSRANRDADTKAVDSLKKLFNTFSTRSKNYPFDYVKEHPDSDFSLILLESAIKTYKPQLSIVNDAFETLQGVSNKTETNKIISSKIKTYIKSQEIKDAVSIGKKAPNFSGPNPEGNIVNLNDIKGKVTLIDFWASWCKPCRRENPNVVRVYEKYHNKGLEIISVSLDKPGKKDIWSKAIKDDKLSWHHVSNLQYWNDPIAKLYQVRSIPATFLLDEDGRIIAKSLRGKALENKIAALLD